VPWLQDRLPEITPDSTNWTVTEARSNSIQEEDFFKDFVNAFPQPNQLKVILRELRKKY